MPIAKVLDPAGAVLNTIELDPECAVIDEKDATTLTLEELASGYFFIVAPGVIVERLD